MSERLFHKSAWIHTLDRRVLVVRSRGNNIFFLPGGGPENQETGKKAVVREMREELAVDLIPRSLRFVRSFEAPSFEFPQKVRVRMRCYTGMYRGTLTPSSEVEEMAWFPFEGRDKTSSVDRLVFDFLKDTDQID